MFKNENGKITTLKILHEVINVYILREDYVNVEVSLKVGVDLKQFAH